MKREILFLLVLVTVMSSVVACMPKAQVLTPSPVTPPPASPISTPIVATISAEESAWAKVVETAKKEGTITIYSTYFVGDTSRRLARDFQNQYGIRVEILAGAGRTSLEKIKVEQQMIKPVADMMQAGGSSLVELTSLGLSTNIWKELPALKEKSAFLVDPVYSPGGEMLQLNLVMYAPTINTRLVKPQDEPKSYFDLLEPKWKGKIIIDNPATIPVTFYSPMYYKALDVDYWRRLSTQNVAIWKGNVVEEINKVARSEFDLAFTGLADTVGPLIAQGAPLKMLVMEEGTAVGGNMIAAVKNSPHPNATKLFLNWLLTPPGQLAYVEPSFNMPIRKDVPDFSIPGAQIKPKKLWPRNWDFEEWAIKEMNRGIVTKIFGQE